MEWLYVKTIFAKIISIADFEVRYFTKICGSIVMVQSTDNIAFN